MGVDVSLVLPKWVENKDVLDYIYVLTGNKPDFDSRQSPNLKSMAKPFLTENSVTKAQVPFKVWNSLDICIFSQYPGEKVIMERSTPIWVAISLKLFEFFGGSIDTAMGERNTSLKQTSKHGVLSPNYSNDDFWKNLKEVKPLGKDDLIFAERYSSDSFSPEKRPIILGLMEAIKEDFLMTENTPLGIEPVRRKI